MMRLMQSAASAGSSNLTQMSAMSAAERAVEEEIRDRKLAGDAKQLHRQGFTPANPFIRALNYMRERRVGLEVFLTDPDVPIDTNHLERALRVVPMGRKSWLFCWTELGADRSKGALFEDYANAVHPEDREFVMARHTQLLGEGGPRKIEFRVVWPDGSIHVLVGRATDTNDNE